MCLWGSLLTCGCGGASAVTVPSPAGAIGTLAAGAPEDVALRSACTLCCVQSQSKFCARKLLGIQQGNEVCNSWIRITPRVAIGPKKDINSSVAYL